MCDEKVVVVVYLQVSSRMMAEHNSHRLVRLLQGLAEAPVSYEQVQQRLHTGSHQCGGSADSTC